MVLWFCNGYMESKYAIIGYLTDKENVYNFGIVALEISSGRRTNISRQTHTAFILFFCWKFSSYFWRKYFFLLLFLSHFKSHVLTSDENLMNPMDLRLGSGFNKEEIMVTINMSLVTVMSLQNLGLSCLQLWAYLKTRLLFKSSS